MRCRTVRAQLVALQDGEVGRSQRVQLFEHLARCARCRKRYEILDALIPVSQLSVPAEVGRQLRTKVRVTPVLAEARERRPPSQRIRRRMRALGAWLQADLRLSRGAALAYGATVALGLAWGWVVWGPIAEVRGIQEIARYLAAPLDEVNDGAVPEHTGLGRPEGLLPQDFRPVNLELRDSAATVAP